MSSLAPAPSECPRSGLAPVPSRFWIPVALVASVWCVLGPGCRDRSPKRPSAPTSPVERLLVPAPTVNVAEAVQALRAVETEPERPWVFRWPLRNIDVTSPYGIRMHPVVNRLLFHSGVDFRAPRGEPVLAAGPGEVTQVGDLPLTGLTVTLLHPGELITLYAHLDELLVYNGQWVAAGAPVGLIGSTGRSTGPHLHFSAYRRRETGRHPLDPTELVGTIIDPRHPPTPPLPPPAPQKPKAPASAAGVPNP